MQQKRGAFYPSFPCLRCEYTNNYVKKHIFSFSRTLFWLYLCGMIRLFLLLIFIAYTFMACDTAIDEVAEKYPDGKPKLVKTYIRKNEKKILQAEKGYYSVGQLQVSGNYNPMGNREGKWTYWYENGNKWSECVYSDGKKEGFAVVWYENGQKRYEGEYRQDIHNGIWKFWDDKGNLIQEVSYSGNEADSAQ
jgi:hypothetical protein